MSGNYTCELFRECFLRDDRLDRGDGILRTIVLKLLRLLSIEMVGLLGGGVLLELSVQLEKYDSMLLLGLSDRLLGLYGVLLELPVRDVAYLGVLGSLCITIMGLFVGVLLSLSIVGPCVGTIDTICAGALAADRIIALPIEYNTAIIVKLPATIAKMVEISILFIDHNNITEPKMIGSETAAVSCVYYGCHDGFDDGCDDGCDDGIFLCRSQ